MVKQSMKRGVSRSWLGVVNATKTIPLTLLNCDYKIATKSIANHLKLSLPDLINYDQTGFIKGSFIGENIGLIDSVICYAKEKNIPGLLLFLDFEKAFDSIEWPFIRKTFQYFGFGSSILKSLNLFYCRPESWVLNNGWASHFLEIQRGLDKVVLSRLIFLFCRWRC